MVIVIKEQAIRFWHLLLSILRLVDNNIRRLFSLPSSYHKIPSVPLVVPLYSRDLFGRLGHLFSFLDGCHCETRVHSTKIIGKGRLCLERCDQGGRYKNTTRLPKKYQFSL